MATNKLFVYGTLRRGQELHACLQRSGARFLSAARIRARLYDLGDFPGAIPSSLSNDAVEGELYELKDTDKLAGIDEVEEFYPDHPGKSLFLRKQAEVRLPAGKRCRAWVYFVRHVPPHARLLPVSDYTQFTHVSKLAAAR